MARFPILSILASEGGLSVLIALPMLVYFFGSGAFEPF